MKKDNCKSIHIDLTDEEFLIIAKLAHEKDITFNDLCNEILLEQLEKEKKVIKKTRKGI